METIDSSPALSIGSSFRPGGFTALAWVIGLAIWTGCGDQEVAFEPTLRSVRYATVEGGAAPQSRTFSGTSKAGQQSRLSFKVAGTLEALPVEVGDRLKRGQLVARLDPFQYSLEAEKAEADLVSAQVTQRSAALTYERTKELYADNNASRGELDAARADAESSAARTRSAEKQVQLSRLNVSYTELRAAVDCSIASVEVEVNENVSAGSTVATVNCGQTVEVEVSIPESLIGGLEMGMPASVHFGAQSAEALAATVTGIGLAAQNDSTFPVTLTLESSHSDLRSGLAAEVSLQIAQAGDAASMLVPLSSVVEGPDGPFVFIAEAAGADQATVGRRAVVLGQLTADGMEVTSGLAIGDRVITAGTSVIYDGLEVLLDATPETPTANDAAAAGEE